MSLVADATATIERAPLPDALVKAGIHYLVSRTRRHLSAQPPEETARFAAEMDNFPIALATDAANAQHYEIPAAFFECILGRHCKYSSGYYETSETTLDGAEAKALALTVANAGLVDGQDILELGCGWGSLTLWMAENLPGAQITAVSNSASQRAHIEQRAAGRGLSNITVRTADMNDFDAQPASYDRVVSVEMFEHIANWRALLARANGWLRADGRLFMHVFSHRQTPYRFDHTDKADWIAQHFFTGGIMPSHDLAYQFGDLFAVEQAWQWNGRHYQRTARDWLANYDRNQPEIRRILADVYGADAVLWNRRWRMFFLATMGLFGHAGGNEWGISHYRLRPVK